MTALASDKTRAPDLRLLFLYLEGGVLPISQSTIDACKKEGIEIHPLSPLGAEVIGLDLRKMKQDSPIIAILQTEMAHRGYLCFRGQGIYDGDEQVRISELWGGKEIHSTHGVHPEAPNKHIFRLSNDPRIGINGVGPQWHNDGSFLQPVFSHVGYHIVRVPKNGGKPL